MCEVGRERASKRERERETETARQGGGGTSIRTSSSCFSFHFLLFSRLGRLAAWGVCCGFIVLKILGFCLLFEIGTKKGCFSGTECCTRYRPIGVLPRAAVQKKFVNTAAAVSCAITCCWRVVWSLVVCWLGDYSVIVIALR